MNSAEPSPSLGILRSNLSDRATPENQASMRFDKRPPTRARNRRGSRRGWAMAALHDRPGVVLKEIIDSLFTA